MSGSWLEATLAVAVVEKADVVGRGGSNLRLAVAGVGLAEVSRLPTVVGVAVAGKAAGEAVVAVWALLKVASAAAMKTTGTTKDNGQPATSEWVSKSFFKNVLYEASFAVNWCCSNGRTEVASPAVTTDDIVVACAD